MKKITLLLLTLFSTTFGNAQELLTNGDFQTGDATGWVNNPNIVTYDDSNYFNEANVESIGSPWDVNISNVLALSPGTTYTLSFDAWSDRNRIISAGIGLNEFPWSNVYNDVSLTDAVQSFSLNFVAPGDLNNNSRVLFDMGAAIGYVGIDNVSLTVLAIEPLTDTTLSDLKMDGTTIDGFASSTSSYSVELLAGTIIVPTIIATNTFTGATNQITNATSIPGSTSILVTSADGTTTNTITIDFTINQNPSTAAPTPTNASIDVISAYSDTYTSIATNLNPEWSQTTVAKEIQIATNNTLKYTNFNSQGLEYTNVDVSAMEFVHLDYYTNNATELEFFLITAGEGENAYDIAATDGITRGQWISLDIPLSHYSNAGRNLADTFQFKIVGNGTIYLDNLYFWKKPDVTGTNTSLSDLTIDGVTINGFDSMKSTYTVQLPIGTTTVPTILATTTHASATSLNTDTTSIPGITTILVTSQDGTTTNTITISLEHTLNLALGRTTDSSADDHQDSANAVDGNGTTRWESVNSETAWWSVDLGASYDLAKVIITWEEAYGDEYTIEISSDNSTWTTIYTEAAGNGGTDDLTISGTGRYIRYNGTSRVLTYAHSFYEFEVYKAVATSGTDTSLSDLTIDGVTINGFDSMKSTYTVQLPIGTTTVPTILATTTHASATSLNTDTTSIPGITTILVTSQDGTTTNTITISLEHTLNLALGRTTDSSADDHQDSANAVDGNGTTRWESVNSETAWWSVDLGASYDLAKVIITWEEAYGDEYTIEISSDNSTWTTIYTEAAGNGGTDDLTISGTGRYIRYNGTSRVLTYAHSFYEFEVYKAVASPVNIKGTWKISPIAGSLAVGESAGNYNWWSNSLEDITTRACLYDDEYVFNENGSFENILGSQTWIEITNSCGTPVAPHDGSNPAAWSVNQEAGTITIIGPGAYLGLPKVHNTGEDGAPENNTIVYNYVISEDGNSLDITISGYNTEVTDATWLYKLTKNNPIAAIGKINRNQIKIYPNPANETININVKDMKSYAIYNVSGKKVMQGTEKQTNISSLKNGIYVLKVIANGTIYTTKIMKR